MSPYSHYFFKKEPYHSMSYVIFTFILSVLFPHQCHQSSWNVKPSSGCVFLSTCPYFNNKQANKSIVAFANGERNHIFKHCSYWRNEDSILSENMLRHPSFVVRLGPGHSMVWGEGNHWPSRRDFPLAWCGLNLFSPPWWWICVAQAVGWEWQEWHSAVKNQSYLGFAGCIQYPTEWTIAMGWIMSLKMYMLKS